MKAGISIVLVASLTVGVAVALTKPVALAQDGGPGDKKVSVWGGVYTAAQSKRGETFYSSACAQCHGLRLNGAGQPDQPPSPAIARAGFLRKWSGQTVAAPFTYVRHKMPSDNPGAFNDQDSIDAVAHMFAVSNLPAGDKELPFDLKVLDYIVIAEQPK
jgi:mono/diheme cytochrome c family protein